ncbi:MAG: NAD(P)/FAD-dependent oxidoreductase [Nocardioidaceae bacterium]|nr:NAD(P)/FAD-dependent oxidoreductase [Nocardioidaceae bacterium]
MYDVVVVGGGAAGLTSGLILARSRRRVVVVDAGEPRNAPAEGVHGFLTRDGLPPGELTRLGADEVRSYGGEVRAGRAVSAERDGDGFLVDLEDGTRLGARRLVVASGAVDELPELPGLADGWGHDVVHCPYCHGWEVRDQRIGVLVSGPTAAHQAHLFRQLSDRLTLLLDGGSALAEEEVVRLAAKGVEVVTAKVVAFEREDGRLLGARLADGRLVPLDVVAVQSRVLARAAVLDALGVPKNDLWAGEHGEHLLGQAYAADPMTHLAAPGVWVAGNSADPMAQVVHAAAAGVRAGAMANADLAVS